MIKRKMFLKEDKIRLVGRFLGVLVLVALLFWLLRVTPRIDTASVQNQAIKDQSETVLAPVVESRCHIRDIRLPDPTCTPGTVFEQATTKEICVSGYTKTVRNVPESLKNQVYAEYGISDRGIVSYEMDHLIPLELGGNNDKANLWPEPATPEPGFKQKDKVENYLHAQVCSGQMTLKDAQQSIAQNWLLVFENIK